VRVDPRVSHPGVMRATGVRAVALAALALVLGTAVLPVLHRPGAPAAVTAAWLGVALSAWIWPRPSLLAWVVTAPLLPILPSLLEWQELPIATFWLSAIVATALARFVVRPQPRALPRAAVVWALIATASIVVVLSPFFASAATVPEFLRELQEYTSAHLMSVVNQRPRLAPILAWFILLEGLAVLWLVLFTFRDRTAERSRWLHHVATAMAVGASLVAVWGIWQRWTRRTLLLEWMLLDPTIVRINASFTDVNALGAYLASALPIVVSLSLSARRVEWKAAGAAAACAVAAATVFTASRAAWAASLAGLGLLTVGTLFWRLPSWSVTTYRTARIAVVSVLLVLTIGLAVGTAWGTSSNMQVLQRDSYVDVVLHTLNLRASPEERLKGRMQFWAAASRMTTAHPLAGVGIGRYYKEVYRWAPDQSALVRTQENAHNYYLQVAAEMGVPGLLAFLGLLGIGAASAVRVCRSPAPRETRMLALGVCSAIVAFSVTLLTGHSLLVHEGQVTFWPMVGLAILLCREWCEPGKAVPPHASRRRLAFVLPLVAVALLVTLPARMADSVTVQDVRVSGVLEDEPLPEGVLGEWTGERVTVDVPFAARGVRVWVRFAAPFPQDVDVTLDGRQVERVTGAPGHVLELQYLVPRSSTRANYRRLGLSVSPAWTREGSRKNLGLILQSAEWVP
jgi:O-antigen ligase